MRLNRGTLVLLVIAAVIIIGVLVINNNQATAPADATPTSEQISEPLFAGITSNTLARFEIRDNTTGSRTVLTRTSENVWGLDREGVIPDPLSGVAVEATEGADDPIIISPEDTFAVETTGEQEIDQTAVLNNLDSFLLLTPSDSFDSDQLDGFGLDRPQYSILASSEDGQVYMLHIGGENPAGNRYYAIEELLSGADVDPAAVGATEEAQAVATEIVESGEPLSAPGDNILGAQLTEVADETDEPDAIATVETIEEAVELGESIEATIAAEATTESTAEATLDVTEEITMPDELLPTATLAPLAEPLVILTGSQTVYVIPKTAIDALIGYLIAPPYAVPTPDPFVLPEPTVEVTMEATEEAEVADEATAEVTPAADITEEATPES
jgi:hypothetical protein